MKSINIELLMGHNIGVSGHYYKPTEQEVLQDYVKAIDALTIDPTQRLKQENAELRKDYLAELGELRGEFNQMKEMLVSLQRGAQKKLVNEFLQRTGDELQDQFFEAEA